MESQYQKVRQTDDDELLADSRTSPDSSDTHHEADKTVRASLRSILMATILISIAVVALICLAFSEGRYRKALSASCGTTPEEARQHGCIFEPMLRSWVPRECYFPEPSTEYDPFHDRKWYLDPRLQVQLNETLLEDLQRGEELMVFTKYYHNEHCLYCWRKLAIAASRGIRLIDSKTADLAHSTHCAKSIAEMIVQVENGLYNSTGMVVSAPLLFQRCVRLF